ncbi:MAG: AAA family ATPase [Synergistaceae bacterium]|jgi:lon-related putative ATP-dependent protease|nr:AAA family ATPase [Synergistaceae bacterium]
MSIIESNKLPVEQLRRRTVAASLGFETTDELKCLKQLIGQAKAVSAVSFALELDRKGYNLFVVGNPGSGRTTFTMEAVKEKARGMAPPDDWVYVYNFDEPGEPLAINLPAGCGKTLASAMSDLVEDLKVNLGKAFDNSEYEDNKATLVKSFQESVGELMESLRAYAAEQSFSIKRTPQGFVNLPLVKEEQPEASEEGDASGTPETGNPDEGDGTGQAMEADEAEKADREPKSVTREMKPDEFEKLSDEEQNAIQKKSEEIAQKTLETLRVMRDREKELKQEIKKLEAEICRNATQPVLFELKEKFRDSEKLTGWIDDLEEDIVQNFGMFVAATRDENAEADFSRFSVNVFVSNDGEGGAPVIHETNPTYYNLMGKVEYESRQGYLYTDFRKIKSGALHRANGGFLVLEAENVLRQFMSWDALKRVLSSGELTIENLGEHLGYIPVASLRPQAVPINVKVVIVGTYYLYYLLNVYDPEFQKIFKIKADFESDMPRNDEMEYRLACVIAQFVSNDGKVPFTAAAVAEVIENASRLVDDQGRMTTQFNKISELLAEATAWAKMEKADRVDFCHVIKAVEEKNNRCNLVEERYFRAFETGVIRIDTEGMAVGQINGLTVISMVDHTFGHPVRISANVFMGQEGIVNIEREVKLTGPIHNKGLMTLSSYLGRMYAQDMPISVSARIAFEQTYGGIEGDSASSTELYCLLSALSGVPLRQDVAVTGSVDQFGSVQPIGGVNEKIEGFFSYCRSRGLTGTQGVMIPRQNVRHLMLHYDVLEAVRDGLFNVWAVSTIDEGIEILTGIPAGVPSGDGSYPADSVHWRTKACLRSWLERSAKLKRELSKGVDADSDDQNGMGAKGKNEQDDD